MCRFFPNATPLLSVDINFMPTITLVLVPVQFPFSLGTRKSGCFFVCSVGFISSPLDEMIQNMGIDLTNVFIRQMSVFGRFYVYRTVQ